MTTKNLVNLNINAIYDKHKFSVLIVNNSKLLRCLCTLIDQYKIEF